MSVQSLIAVYGAIAGTVALLIQLRDYLNKRGVLRVHAKINQVRMTPDSVWETNLVMEITNIGLVPVLVRNVCVAVGDYSCESRIDKILSPGQMFRTGHDLEKQGYPPNEKRRAWIEDGRGKRWSIGEWWLLWRKRKVSTISEEM